MQKAIAFSVQVENFGCTEKRFRDLLRPTQTGRDLVTQREFWIFNVV